MSAFGVRTNPSPRTGVDVRYLEMSFLVLMSAQFALRRRKAGISRTSSSIELCTGEDRPYESRRCGAALRAYSEPGGAGRPSEWRVVGGSGGGAECGSGGFPSPGGGGGWGVC